MEIPNILTETCLKVKSECLFIPVNRRRSSSLIVKFDVIDHILSRLGPAPVSIIIIIGTFNLLVDMRIKGIVLLILRFIFSDLISFSCFLIGPDAFNSGIEPPSEHPAEGGNCSFPVSYTIFCNPSTGKFVK